MLTVVLGNVDLMKMQMGTDHPLEQEVAAVEQAALRSKEMARQLLAFSRQQIISPVVLDLNAQIAATHTLFATLIGEQVTVDFRPAAGLWPVLCDPSQIDQVLLNLVVNARDAMPRGGTITVETANVTLDAATLIDVPGASAGSYVTLSVRDEGEGIDPRILPRIFEPFFTTKRVDKGTGLGLATVYGIVKQNGWFIGVDSEPGRGATFRLYMTPATGRRGAERTAGDGAAASRRRNRRPSMLPHRATILLVEDDEMVRNLTSVLLGSLGYTVLVSESPAAAIARLGRRRGGAGSAAHRRRDAADDRPRAARASHRDDARSQDDPHVGLYHPQRDPSGACRRGRALHPEAVHQAGTRAGDPRALVVVGLSAVGAGLSPARQRSLNPAPAAAAASSPVRTRRRAR